jgi:hypothetical protein
MKSGAIVHDVKRVCDQFLYWISMKRKISSFEIDISSKKKYMARNKEKQKNELNRLYLSKTNPRKFKKSIKNFRIFSFISL